ncbi:MAG: DUF1553 domain-containing protein, partial [Fuerstiella sp.]|nr:DUF1553 domain-containing protein [Fuerstiella sp.]
DRKQFGPPVGIKEDDTGQVIVDGGQKRRSMYIKVRRSRPVAMLQAFDAPVMQTNCEIRPTSTVATQALMLMNGKFILEQAGSLADRAAIEAQPVRGELLAALPKTPDLPKPAWSYGFGSLDAAKNRTTSFTSLDHWTGSQWQAGPVLPNPEHGWVLLRAAGGHPDTDGRSVIRRWTASTAGTVS